MYEIYTHSNLRQRHMQNRTGATCGVCEYSYSTLSATYRCIYPGVLGNPCSSVSGTQSSESEYKLQQGGVDQRMDYGGGGVVVVQSSSSGPR